MSRGINLLMGCILGIFLVLPILFLALLVRLTSQGPAFHWSSRVGQNSSHFDMPKLRTMFTDAPDVATHLFESPEKYVTPIGRVLRKTSLDELPQVWSVIKGDMGFVGPRPALFNQNDLIALRTDRGVNILVPGITGWAQIQGRDELPILEKVAMDVYYLKHRSFWLDLKILWFTLIVVFTRRGVSH
jgi:O-antigen biosynthesis protein WbqP